MYLDPQWRPILICLKITKSKVSILFSQARLWHSLDMDSKKKRTVEPACWVVGGTLYLSLHSQASITQDSCIALILSPCSKLFTWLHPHACLVALLCFSLVRGTCRPEGSQHIYIEWEVPNSQVPQWFEMAYAGGLCVQSQHGEEGCG